MNYRPLLVLMSISGGLLSACAPVQPRFLNNNASLICSAAELNLARLEEDGSLPPQLQFNDAEPLRGRYSSAGRVACGSHISTYSRR